MLYLFDSSTGFLGYVDPGSGAMLVQALIASFVGGFAWISSKLFFRKKSSKTPDELDTEAGGAPASTPPSDQGASSLSK